MKPKFNLPWFSKYLFSFFVVAFVFLLAGYISKPAYAAGCNVNTTVPVTPGYTLNVYAWGIDYSQVTGLTLKNNSTGNLVSLGSLQSPDGPHDYAIPSTIPLGTYTAWAGVGVLPFQCSGGTDYVAGSNPGTGQVKIIPPLCSVGFSPNPVSPNGTLTVTLSGHVGDSFAVGITGGWPAPNTGSGKFGDSPLTFTAPASGGPFIVGATDTTWGNNCVIAPGSSNPVTIGTGGPTPTPPAGTGCTFVPANTNWSLSNTVSGYTVQFTFGDTMNSGAGMTGNGGIIIENASDGSVAKDSGPLGSVATPATTWQWTLPQGSYCAVVTGLGTYISKVVNFNIPATGPLSASNCPIVTKPWLDTVYNDAINKSYFDSSVFTLGQAANTIDSIHYMLWGCSLQSKKLNSVSSSNNGALAFMSNAVASLYAAPPASGVIYMAQKIHDINPVQPAFAGGGGNLPGGIGYQTLGPVQKIWVAFRNIAYVGFIIVFVVIGFMVMFRAHISPQAVATVQDSIPRLVIALILVTFSYAIAGFMIDIMFLILNIAVNALVQVHLIKQADYVFTDNVFTVIWTSWKDIFGSVASAIETLIGNVIHLPGIFGDLFGWAGAGIAAIVIGIAVLFIMFRIFLMLLMAYVMIILLTMFAPFFFLIQALPGNNGAKEWFKQMASNIAVFPVVALMFILAGILGGIDKLAPGSAAAIQPGNVGQFPLLIGGLDTQAIGQLIGIGILLITPTAAEIVKNSLGVKGGPGGVNAGAVIAGELGGGARVASYPGRWAAGRISEKKRNERFANVLQGNTSNRQPGSNRNPETGGTQH